MTTLLLVATRSSEPRTPGGVDLVYDALRPSTEPGRHVVRLPPCEVQDVARSWRNGPVVVYTQNEGRLSASFRARVDSWLGTGAHVVEKNVFALPSRFRPQNPRYHMALMSMDGLHRYAWRSFAARARPVEAALVLPNPAVHSIEPPHVREIGRPLEEVTLLRLGRPDPVKWTDFELRWARALARSEPQRRFRLRLVGAPSTATVVQDLPANLSVTREPFSTDPMALYRTSDVLVHHSRIGETFGNTIFEALEAGLGVVCALEPRWDCAPLEYLRGSGALVGMPGALLLHPALPPTARCHPPIPVRLPLTVFLDHLVRVASGDAERKPVPSPARAFQYFLKVASELGGRRAEGVLAALMEAGRARRHRALASPG